MPSLWAVDHVTVTNDRADAVTNVTAQAMGDTAVSLTWTLPAGYEDIALNQIGIEFSTDGVTWMLLQQGGGGPQIQAPNQSMPTNNSNVRLFPETGRSATHANIINLTAGSTYYFRVSIATATQAASAWTELTVGSPNVTVATDGSVTTFVAKTYTPPATVTNLKVDYVTDSLITISWDPPADNPTNPVTGYYFRIVGTGASGTGTEGGRWWGYYVHGGDTTSFTIDT